MNFEKNKHSTKADLLSLQGLFKQAFFYAILLSAHLFGESAKPNLIIFFTDDQGYGDLSCFNNSSVYTPNIDQMAKEGARLTSFYVAAPVCTPSRAALMTGCYPRRIDMETASNLTVIKPGIDPKKHFPVCLAGDGKGLNPDEVTIAEIAKSVGYKTGIFGKWHLGDQPEFLPTRQGFDEFFGLPYSHDITPKHPRQKYFNFPPLPVLEGEEVVEMSPNSNYLTRRITERAVDFIKRNKEDNFFLYVPQPLPHGPLAASPEIKEEYASVVKSQKLGKEKSGIYAGPKVSPQEATTTKSSPPWTFSRPSQNSSVPTSRRTPSMAKTSCQYSQRGNQALMNTSSTPSGKISKAFAGETGSFVLTKDTPHSTTSKTIFLKRKI